jgi:cytochrome b6-f complex iron-sulfur subunit
MADQESKASAGVLGHLPPWPRKALNNSVIAMEQAYRKRSGLPLLSDADVEALKAGLPLPFEGGDGASPAATPAPTASAATPVPSAPSAPPAPAPAVATSAASAAPSAEVKAMLDSGRKWSRSAIAMEQAARKRKGLTPLTEAEVTLLLGEPATPAAAPAAATSAAAAPAVGRPAAAAAAPAAVAAPIAPPPVTREGAAVAYVGSPAVGTSKAAPAAGIATAGPENTEINQKRRRLIWASVIAFLSTWLLVFFRFFLPRTLFEPSTIFKIGYASDYGLGVDTKWQQKYRIWVDRTPDRLFVIYARCTHLGCTPDWKPAENKFKCPCHGSGYDSEGVNFEGPAPRPMDRAHVDLAPDGQVIVDVSRLYQWPKGQASHFDDPGSFLHV